MEKLEIMIKLANEQNIDQVLDVFVGWQWWESVSGWLGWVEVCVCVRGGVGRERCFLGEGEKHLYTCTS